MIENRKKNLILYILCVIVLVILIVGVSYALFGFSGSGVTESIVTTGSVNVIYSDTYDKDNNPLGKGVIAINNAFPQSDSEALKNLDNTIDFTVSAKMSGKMNIVYDIGVTDLEEGKTLTADYIKIALLDDNGYVLGTENLGEVLSSRKNLIGDNELIDHYFLASGKFDGEEVDHYKLVVWVSDEYEFPTVTTDVGTSHTATTLSEEFSFKLNIIASQA